MIYKCFLDEWKKLRSFSHYQMFTWFTDPDISSKLENLLLLEFFFNPCKTVEVSQNDQIRMYT